MSIKIPKGKGDNGFGGAQGVILSVRGGEDGRYSVIMYPLIVNGVKQESFDCVEAYHQNEKKTVYFETDADGLIEVLSGRQLVIGVDPVNKDGYMTINEIRNRAFEDAKKHGFYPEGHSVQESLMDIICEATEAVDADEKGKRSTIKNPDYDGLIDADWGGVKSPGYRYFFQQTAKDTLEDELADIIIRTASLAGYLNIDLETHIRAKMRYNEGRSYLHKGEDDDQNRF